MFLMQLDVEALQLDVLILSCNYNLFSILYMLLIVNDCHLVTTPLVLPMCGFISLQTEVY